MTIKPRSVEKVWIPTAFSQLDDESGVSQGVNLAGCENCHASPQAMAAVQRALRQPQRLLLEHWDSQDNRLRNKLAALHGVSPQQVFLTSGAMGAIRYVFEIFVSADTNVGLLKPDFPGFVHYADKVRATVHWCANETFPFEHAVERVQAFVHENDIGFLIFSNPSAVTGTKQSTKQVEELLDAAPETLFVVDEADAIETDSVAGLTQGHQNLLVIRSFSKFYGLSGLRVGYVITPPAFIEHFDRTINPAELSSIALVAASAALDDIEYQAATQQKVAESLSALTGACEGTPYQVVPGSVCFAAYIWAAEGVEDPYVLLGHHGIDIAEGAPFGLNRGGRINLSNPENVRIAAEVIHGFS